MTISRPPAPNSGDGVVLDCRVEAVLAGLGSDMQMQERDAEVTCRNCGSDYFIPAQRQLGMIGFLFARAIGRKGDNQRRGQSWSWSWCGCHRSTNRQINGYG